MTEKIMILNHMLFATLDKKGQQCVRQYVDEQLHSAVIQCPPIELVDVLRQQKSLSALLPFYMKKLDKLNTARFHYLLPHQKIALEEELMFTFFIMMAQYEYKIDLENYFLLKNLEKKIQQCASLIHQLRQTSSEPHQMAEKALRAVTDASEKPCEYLGLVILGPWIGRYLWNFFFHAAEKAEGFIADIETNKPYWSFNQGFLASALNLFSTHFEEISSGKGYLQDSSSVLNYLNGILSSIRVGVNLCWFGLYLTKPIKESKNLPYWEAFYHQWHAYKLSLMRDLTSATTGILCFYWTLVNSPFLHDAGFLVLATRLIHLASYVWEWNKEENNYAYNMALWEAELLQLLDKMAALEAQEHQWMQELLVMTEEHAREVLNQNIAQNQLERQILEMHLESIRDIQGDYYAEHRVRRHHIHLEMGYLTGLIAGTSLIVCTLIPPLALAKLPTVIFQLVGASICLLSVIVYAKYKDDVQIQEHHRTEIGNQRLCEFLLKKYEQSTDENEKKGLYLDLLELQVSSAYERQIMTYRQLEKFHKLFLHGLLPPVLLVTLIFSPPVGFGLMVGALIYSSFAVYYMEKQRPKPAEAPEFDEEAFNEFNRHPNMETLQGRYKLGFFDHAEKPEAPTPSELSPVWKKN